MPHKTWQSIQHKVVDPELLEQRLRQWHAAREKVVFTNGCFDILHYGHLYLLARAKDLGDHLVVAINTDSSVIRLKGPNRPINSQTTRAMQLAALSMVDMVTYFSEDTPLAIIKRIMPDILVKGGDYGKKDIVGANEVEAAGGQVVTIPFQKGYSTTELLSKLDGKAGL